MQDETQVEIIDCQAYVHSLMERLQAICEKHGCQAGQNRVDFIEDTLDDYKEKNDRLVNALGHLKMSIRQERDEIMAILEALGL